MSFSRGKKQLADGDFESRLLFLPKRQPCPWTSNKQAGFKLLSKIENFRCGKVESRQSASVLLRANANVCLKTVPLFPLPDFCQTFQLFPLSPRQRKSETKCQVKHRNVVSKVLRFNYSSRQSTTPKLQLEANDSIQSIVKLASASFPQ